MRARRYRRPENGGDLDWSSAKTAGEREGIGDGVQAKTERRILTDLFRSLIRSLQKTKLHFKCERQTERVYVYLYLHIHTYLDLSTSLYPILDNTTRFHFQ